MHIQDISENGICIAHHEYTMCNNKKSKELNTTKNITPSNVSINVKPELHKTVKQSIKEIKK